MTDFRPFRRHSARALAKKFLVVGIYHISYITLNRFFGLIYIQIAGRLQPVRICQKSNFNHFVKNFSVSGSYDYLHELKRRAAEATQD